MLQSQKVILRFRFCANLNIPNVLDISKLRKRPVQRFLHSYLEVQDMDNPRFIHDLKECALRLWEPMGPRKLPRTYLE